MKVLALALLSVILLGSCLKSVDTPSVLVQLQTDTTAISNYLKQNKITATKLYPGIWFSIDSAAAGVRATFGDSIHVTYSMKLLSTGTTVDQSLSPATFALPNLISGIQAAMPYFQKGSKGRIFIPSLYAYRDTGYGNVPPNSVLIFEFKLVDVDDYHLKSDTVAINNYVKNNNLNSYDDPSGLRFSTDTLGGGAIPKISDRVIVNYSITLLTGETIQAFTKTPVTVSLQDYVLGWEIVLTKAPVGTFYTIYLPSSLAFGPNPPSQLSNKTYANLIYKVKVIGLASQ